MTDAKNDDFLSGYLVACQTIAAGFGPSTGIEEAIKASGYPMSDWLRIQKETGFCTTMMNKIIREAFRQKNHKGRTISNGT